MPEEFQAVFGAPEYNSSIEYDWREFEEDYSIRLPEDYKAFLSAYGPGLVNETLLLFHPRSIDDSDHLSLAAEIRNTSQSYARVRSNDPAAAPYPIFPEVDWVVPIGRDTVGNQVFLKPNAGSTWTIAVDWHQGWTEYGMGFSDFLLQAVRGVLDPPFFDEWNLENGASFIPEHRIR